MNSNSNNPRRLYCHFFQTTNSCRKGGRCDFIHDSSIPTCPNGKRCPIKVVHEEIQDNTELERKDERSTKVPLTRDNEIEDTPKIVQNKIPVVPKSVLFSATMSGWDDSDIIKDEKPKVVKVVTIEKESESKRSLNNKKQIDSKTATSTNGGVSKTNSDELNNKPYKKVRENNKENTVEQEMEIEESKQEIKKQPSTNVLIKQNLPDDVQQFIQRHYSKNQEAQNFISNLYFMNQDIKNFLPIYETLFPKMELDLMFLVDCTGSMSAWIDAVKLEISGIVAAIKNQHQGCQIRVSFVGYRDYGDAERYSIFNFSEDLEAFQDFVGKVQATGGSDAAEDVAGGFKRANSQNWKSKAKYAVLLADAPAHGIQYHGDRADFYDRYPKGDPDGVDLKDEFKSLINKGVKLYAVEIMKSTDMMYKIFKTYNKDINGTELDVMKLGNSTQGFGQYISNTASQTLSQSYTRESKEDPQGAFYKAMKIFQGMNTVQSVNFLDRYNFTVQKSNTETGGSKSKKNYKIVNLTVSPTKIFTVPQSAKNIQAVCHTYFIVQDKGVPINWRKPLVQNSSIKTSIKINSTPFAEGAMRYAFHAQDTLLNQQLVAKINKKLSVENAEQDKEDMAKDLESQFICQHIVNQFNDRASEHVQTTANLKNFVHCFIYEIQDPNHPYKYYSAENYISGDYEKFNNNAGWTNLRFDEPGLLSQALSHFSYQITEGYLMIVDLQGVGGLLTDPQIHCLDQHRFGAGNLGYQGMFKFFLSHSCNKYCQNLNLVHPKIQEIPKSLKFFDNELIKPTDLKKQVFCMCDLCKVPFQTTAGYVYSKKQQCFERYCPSCDQKRNATLKSAQCTNCNTTFKSSTYWFLMKRTDFPELCGPCRKQRRERMRAELN